jgi:hypothetical protein
MENGSQKGDAMIVFDDAETAPSAVSWFNGICSKLVRDVLNPTAYLRLLSL